MRCQKCSFRSSNGKRQPHFHIVMRDGKVISVAYLSMFGGWDRVLDPDEYVVLCEDTEPSYKVYED